MSRTLNVSARSARGLSLVELMIAIAIGMVIVAALLALYLNVTRTNSEMAKMNRQIENGRFAIQMLEDDVVHAGFWGAYVPQFEDLTTVTAPLDAPTAVPDPCLAYSAANWNANYLSELIGIGVQGDAGTCALGSQQANTDVLVVRHAMNCVAGVGNCEADSAGKLYFQSALCEKEMWALAQAGTTNTITLDAGASSTDGYYNGVQIRILYGTGKDQSRTITAYNGTTKVATVDSAWAIIPQNDSAYAFGLGYVLGVSDGTPANPPFIFHQRDCVTPAVKRKFVSDIYYIRDFAVTPGDGIPTLMRSTFDGLAQQPAQALIEGIEGFRVMYGIDSQGKGGVVEDYTKPVSWTDPYSKITPKNRGDGVAEGAFVNDLGVTCTGVNSCPAANVVAVRIYVLARSNETTPGYVDTKTYQLGDLPMGPFNDGYKRHVYSTTVRLVNPSGRRDTP